MAQTTLSHPVPIRTFPAKRVLSRRMRGLIVAFLLSVVSNSFVATAFAPVVHADSVDCSKDDNKDADECKK